MAKVLVLTDLSGLPEATATLSKIGELQNAWDKSGRELRHLIQQADYIFTNPNKRTVFLGEAALSNAADLKVICTASTGLTHIDVPYCSSRGIEIISLREERELLKNLPSTAELALGLTLSALRNIIPSSLDVQLGNWDYRVWMGSQLRGQAVGVVGLGRLGGMYAEMIHSLGSEVFFYDPFVDNSSIAKKVDSLEDMVRVCRVVSLHAHVTDESKSIIGGSILRSAKSDLVLINTARGELVDENAVLNFIRSNPNSAYYTDVLASEHLGPLESPVVAESKLNSRVVVTPHVGGMTFEGQKLAYSHAARMLLTWHNARIFSED